MSNLSVLKRSVERQPGVTTEWIVVTPELATKWLEGNVHNRSVRDSLVTRYATDMGAGRWRQTHQGIAFDEEDRLIDGQHRLFAVIEADVPVLLMVTRGLPMETQLVVDDVAKRSVVDVLKIDGEPMADITPMHTAVANRMHYGLRPRSTEGYLTRQESITFIKKHWEAIHFPIKLMPTRKRVAKIAPAPVLATVSRAYYYEDMAGLTRFLQVLTSGLPQKQTDEVIITLRNWLLTRKSSGGDDMAREIFAKTCRAVVAFAKGQMIKNGRLYGVSEDPYPLPQKNGAKR